MKIYDNVLQRVRINEKRNGIDYAKTDGRLYNTLRKIYLIIGIYILFMNLAYILGHLMVISDGASVKMNIITVSVCTALMILGYIFSKRHFPLICGIVSVAAEVYLIIHYVQQYTDRSMVQFTLAPIFFRFSPLIPMVVLIIFLTVIAVRARIKTVRAYKIVIENLYETYKAESNSNLNGEVNEDDWEEYLKNFHPNGTNKRKENKKDKKAKD